MFLNDGCCGEWSGVVCVEGFASEVAVDQVGGYSSHRSVKLVDYSDHGDWEKWVDFK